MHRAGTPSPINRATMPSLAHILLVSLISLSYLATSNELPELGNSARNLITPQQELHLGQSLSVSYTHLTLPTTPYV